MNRSGKTTLLFPAQPLDRHAATSGLNKSPDFGSIDSLGRMRLAFKYNSVNNIYFQSWVEKRSRVAPELKKHNYRSVRPFQRNCSEMWFLSPPWSLIGQFKVLISRKASLKKATEIAVHGGVEIPLNNKAAGGTRSQAV